MDKHDEAMPNNGVVATLPAESVEKTAEKPVIRLTASELRRFYTFAERKIELEQIIVASQLAMTEAAVELKEVNARYAAIQGNVSARFGFTGPFQVTPDGVVIPLAKP